MSLLCEGLSYCIMIVLVIISWSCWIDNDTTKVDSMVCLSICTDLDVCGLLPKDAIIGEWGSFWFESLTQPHPN